MNQENIDDISQIEKDNQAMFKDESAIAFYKAFFTISKPHKETLHKKVSSLTHNNSPLLLSHKKDLKACHKYTYTSSLVSPFKKNTMPIQQSDITTQPVSDFLSNQDCYHLSYAQSEYMSMLDSLYSSKIKRINDIYSKYDNELFSLKEYVDGTNRNNINNIIYNSVLKDKMEELRVLEEDFVQQKKKALLTYNLRGKKMNDIFNKEIQNTINDIKNDVIEQMKAKCSSG